MRSFNEKSITPTLMATNEIVQKLIEKPQFSLVFSIQRNLGHKWKIAFSQRSRSLKEQTSRFTKTGIFIREESMWVGSSLWSMEDNPKSCLLFPSMVTQYMSSTRIASSIHPSMYTHSLQVILPAYARQCAVCIEARRMRRKLLLTWNFHSNREKKKHQSTSCSTQHNKCYGIKENETCLSVRSWKTCLIKRRVS